MAQQTLDLGAGNNTGDGETLRSGMSKANDNFAELYQRHEFLGFAVMRQVAGQSISAATRTLITFDTVDQDSDSIISGNTLVVPTGAGYQFVEVSVEIQATQSSAATAPRLEITRNATTLTVASTTAGAFNDFEDTGTSFADDLTFSVACADGDVFRAYLTCTNAATLYAAFAFRGYGRRETP